MADTEFVAS